MPKVEICISPISCSFADGLDSRDGRDEVLKVENPRTFTNLSAAPAIQQSRSHSKQTSSAGITFVTERPANRSLIVYNKTKSRLVRYQKKSHITTIKGYKKRDPRQEALGYRKQSPPTPALKDAQIFSANYAINETSTGQWKRTYSEAREA